MDKNKIMVDLGRIKETMLANDMFGPITPRLTVTMDHEIDDELIVKAWERTKRVYPVIDAVLGFECEDPSVYMDAKKAEEHLTEHLYLMYPEGGENKPLKSKVPVKAGTPAFGGRLIGISYYGRDIFITAYHTLVDGGGLGMVAKTFLYSYLALYTGHEDEHPVVELEEGRKVEDYYSGITQKLVFETEYTPVELYSLPYHCDGFFDKDMVRDNGHVRIGSIYISQPEFIAFCKKNKANPSSMMCALLAKAAYALNPEEKRDIIFTLTVASRSLFGLDKSIANCVGLAVSYATREELEGRSLAEIAGRIRKEVDTQRTLDYYISFGKVFATYKHDMQGKKRIVTYMGNIDIGDNTGHMVDVNMATFSYSNLYLVQLNDRFILTLMYGRATEKYLKEFLKIFDELGIQAGPDLEVQEAMNGAEEPVL